MIMHQWFRSTFMETWVGFLDSPKGQRILNGTGATRANMVEQEYYLSNTSAFLILSLVVNLESFLYIVLLNPMVTVSF